jgi:hypothetical protein
MMEALVRPCTWSAALAVFRTRAEAMFFPFAAR